MNYEKKYKEALERARQFSEHPLQEDSADIVEYIFPELVGREDERIRKEIHIYLDWLDGRKDYAPKGIYSIKDMIAWLEKQGEQQGKSALEAWKDMRLEVYQQASGNRHEPNYSDDTTKMFSLNDIDEIIEKMSEQSHNDMVEPKFKVGDWVASNICNSSDLLHIIDKDGKNYEVETPQGNTGIPSIAYVDSNFHLWTIQDAKDGDLIYVSTEIKGIQAIFHKFENGIIYFHCNLCSDFTQGGYEPSGDVECVYPLQKTHYQKFFQKMKEAGYEWDSDKKELKKIESKKFNANEVIEWIHKYWPLSWGNFTLQVDDAIDKFKKDFEL